MTALYAQTNVLPFAERFETNTVSEGSQALAIDNPFYDPQFLSNEHALVRQLFVTEFGAFMMEGHNGFADNILISITQPQGIDLDGDGLPDDWELQYFGNLDQDGDEDFDCDGLSNAQEYAYGADPDDTDTDDDGISDGAEGAWGYNPTVSNFCFRIDAEAGTNAWATGFETEEGYSAGGLNGQQGWQASGNAMVVSNQSYGGAQSAMLPSPSTTNTPSETMSADIFAGGRTEAWVSMYAKIQGPCEDVDTDDTALLVFMNDDKLHAYDVTLGDWVVSENTFSADSNGWYRLDFGLNFTRKTYLACVNGLLAIDNLGFCDITIDSLSQVAVMGGASTNNAETYVDDIRFAAKEPAGALDFEGDGLSNTDEYASGSDPRVSDTDNDGLSDYDEVKIHGTDPADADTDNDGLSDYDEVITNALQRRHRR